MGKQNPIRINKKSKWIRDKLKEKLSNNWFFKWDSKNIENEWKLKDKIKLENEKYSLNLKNTNKIDDIATINDVITWNNGKRWS